ncbi:deoxycytidine deaminase [Bradyrhizobium sp. UNPF46]|uniref:dCTP deaminase n=1 Tax=Bradyrhizobium sp. UNPF46 TaxID=1141168 RepID=UPI0011543CBB|nr:deoxycytidine deaminase [Bradyrhizobium sp. UNPF46]TQF27665.1 deoxycytidine deaminase [Bradyrhizobium sp. UNPF46]
MILTGSEIRSMRSIGRIKIEPFEPSQINPNSYNYRLGRQIAVPTFKDGQLNFEHADLPADGYVLKPRTMYLGHTFEVLGSNTFAMRLIGRSSLGRLGLFLQVSADLGHTGSSHQWTLEIVAALPFKIYPYMRIGQISFWQNYGSPNLYREGYAAFSGPTPSRL